jgi:hypothetical protein
LPLGRSRSQRRLLMQTKAFVGRYHEAAKREAGVEMHEAIPAPEGGGNPERRPPPLPDG